MEFKYKTTFASTVRAIVSEERDAFLAKASLAELSKYIPNIDAARNIDLLPCAFNSCLGGRANKNDDVISNKDLASIAKLFLQKPINIEHVRKSVIGAVVSYTFSKFGSNEQLTEEEAIKSNDPVNLTLGAIIWRLYNKEMADFIEEASDPSSDRYEAVSASWELCFPDYMIASISSGSKNLSDAKIITDQEEISKISSHLRAFGGKGVYQESKIYRLIGDNALPLGIGFTESPAAEVKGIATPKTIQEDVKEQDKTDVSDANVNMEENSSHIVKNHVNTEEKAIAMNITKLEDINDEVLKQVKASEITEWVKSELNKAAEEYTKEKESLNTQIKAAQEMQEKLVKDAEKLKGDLQQVSAELGELKKEKETRAKQDAFNVRMSKLDNVFQLDEKEREIIAADIAEMNDEAFAGYEKKLDVLLAAKKKNGTCAKCKKAKAECICEDDMEEEKAKKCKASEEKKEIKQEAKASEEVKEVVEKAVDNSKKEGAVANTTDTKPETVFDKYKKAFGVDQWISDVKLTED